MHGGHDGLRAVVHRGDAHRPRELGHDHRHLVADALGHLHGVGSRLPVDGQDHDGRGNRVPPRPEVHRHALVLDRLPDVGDVAQVHGRAVGRGHHEALVGLDAVELPVGPEERGARGRVELAGAGIAGAAADGRRQVVDRDAPRPHRAGVRLDADRRLGAEDGHAAHPRQDADALADLDVPVVVELPGRDRVARQRDVHDRLVVRIRLGQGRRRREVDREAPGGLRDRGLDVGRRGVDVLVQGELEGQAHVPLGALRRDDLEAGDLHELALERRRDVVGHRVRAGAGVVGLHLDDRVVHGGQVVHRQLPVAEDAEQHHRGGEDRRHDRPADERLGQVHGFGAAPGSAGLRRAARVVDADLPAGHDAHLAVGDDLLARLHARRDDDEVALALPERHRPEVGGPVGLDHVDEEALRGVLGRADRHQHRAGDLPEDQPDVHEAPGPKPPLAVRDRRAQLDGARPLLHRVVDERQGAGHHGARLIGQPDLDREAAVLHVPLDPGEVVLGHRELGVDGVEPLDAQERARVRGDDVAEVGQALPRAPVDGRANLRVGQLETRAVDHRLVGADGRARVLDGGLAGHHRGLGLGEPRLGRRDGGLAALDHRLVGPERRRRRLHRRPYLIALLAGDVALADQLGVALILHAGVLELGLVLDDVGLGLGELRPRLGQGGLGLRHRGLVARGVRFRLARLSLVSRHVGLGLLDGRLDRARVDREQEIALLHVGAVGEVDLDDPARDLGLERHDLVRHAPAHGVDVERRVAHDRRGHRHGRRRALEARLLLLTLARRQRECEDTHPGQRPGPGQAERHTLHHDSCGLGRITRRDATAPRGDSGVGSMPPPSPSRGEGTTLLGRPARTERFCSRSPAPWGGGGPSARTPDGGRTTPGGPGRAWPSGRRP